MAFIFALLFLFQVFAQLSIFIMPKTFWGLVDNVEQLIMSFWKKTS